MIRALWLKEWHQLAALRWVGLGLGLGLPLLLGAVAEAARRGWMPFGRISSYSMEDILRDAVPAGLVGLWGLMALLIVAQAFTGDRSAGTEQFLLERPVPRRRIWAVRLAVAGATTLLLALAHTGFWSALSQIVLDMPVGAWRQRIGIMAVGGTVLIVTGLIGGLAGSAFVRSPIQALLSGGVLATAPMLFHSGMNDMFPMARIGMFSVAGLFAWLLLPIYLLASFVMDCRGEPAGRGRWIRGVIVLSIGIVAIPLLFLLSAGPLVRVSSQVGTVAWVPAPRGEGAFLVRGSGDGLDAGLWVDLENPSDRRFFAPPVEWVRWEPTGERFAIVHSAGPFGSVRNQVLVEVRQASDGATLRQFELPEEIVLVVAMDWVGGRVLLIPLSTSQSTIEFVLLDPENGAMTTFTAEADAGAWELLGPYGDGRYDLLRTTPGDPPTHELFPVDFDAGAVSETSRGRFAGRRAFRKRLSPDGRRLLTQQRGSAPVGQPSRGPEVWVYHLESGTHERHADWIDAHWLPDGRLLAVEWGGWSNAATRLIVQQPDGSTAVAREWDGARVFLEPDEQGRKFLAQVWRRSEPQPGEEKGFQPWAASNELVLFDAVNDLWSPIYDGSEAMPCAPSPTWRFAGDDRLALINGGRLGLRSIEGDGEIEWVIGRPCPEPEL